MNMDWRSEMLLGQFEPEKRPDDYYYLIQSGVRQLFEMFLSEDGSPSPKDQAIANYKQNKINIEKEDLPRPEGYDIKLKHVDPGRKDPLKTKLEDLPFVSFGFGRNRAASGAPLGDVAGNFYIYVYAVIGKEADEELLKTTGDMYTCVDAVTRSLRTFSTDEMDVKNTRILDMRTPLDRKASEKEFMIFIIEVSYEEYGNPEER